MVPVGVVVDPVGVVVDPVGVVDPVEAPVGVAEEVVSN